MLAGTEKDATAQVPQNPWTPPEYFPSKAVLIEWDFNNSIWPLYSELIRECRDVVEVIMVVQNQSEENNVRNRLIADSVPLGNISFVHVPCERMWIRDHGPLAVMTSTGVAYIDLDDLANSGLDEDLPTNLANLWGLDSYQLPYILCGGNFMVNSFNTLFTTDRIYSSNPGYSPAQIQNDLEIYMGITSVVTFSAQHNDYWGHIDMQIKLLDDSTFVISSADPGSGPNYDTLENNYQRLAALTTPFGKPYRIRKLPMADNWKTYANSLILNNKVIIPVYNHPNDSVAFNIYSELLPNHTLVGINCNQIIGWEGAVHCITMQLFDDTQIGIIKNLSVRDNPLTCYPNPVRSGNNLTLLWNSNYGTPITLSILSEDGRELEQISLKNRLNPYTLIWRHKPGIYFMRVLTDDGNSTVIPLISE